MKTIKLATNVTIPVVGTVTSADIIEFYVEKLEDVLGIENQLTPEALSKVELIDDQNPDPELKHADCKLNQEFYSLQVIVEHGEQPYHVIYALRNRTDKTVVNDEETNIEEVE